MTADATFSCPECSKRYRWKAELAGRRVRCGCQAAIQVPDAPPLDDAYDLADDPDETESCPGCGREMPPGNALCLHCGYNSATGQAGGTSVAAATTSSPGLYTAGSRRVHRVVYAGGFMERISRSWEYVKVSYSIIWQCKRLLVFPVLSGLAALAVFASFLAPLAGTGTIDDVRAFLDEDTAAGDVPLHVYVLVFIFYFCSYFVIVFFNTALAACALRVCDGGQRPTIGYGLSIAMRRLPQIAGWAVISATVGLLLKMLENNRKVGRFVSAILGTAWTIMTYFVVPVLAAEGLGPVEAFKRSVSTLRDTWGEALVGNFSITFVSFILALPIFVVLFLAMAWAGQAGYPSLAIAMIAAMIALALLVAITSSAADMIFRTLLYNYATGATIPDDVDADALEAAFGRTADE